MMHKMKERSQGKKEEINSTHISMREFYKYYRDNYSIKDTPYDIDEVTYRKVISMINYEIAQKIATEPMDFVIPHRLGRLCVRKTRPRAIEDSRGHPIITYPIDWKATWDLWNRDEEAKEQKKLVRNRNSHSGGDIYKLVYRKEDANYNNKSAYNFQFARTLKQNLKNTIINNEGFDSYEL